MFWKHFMKKVHSGKEKCQKLRILLICQKLNFQLEKFFRILQKKNKNLKKILIFYAQSLMSDFLQLLVKVLVTMSKICNRFSVVLSVQPSIQPDQSNNFYKHNFIKWFINFISTVSYLSKLDLVNNFIRKKEIKWSKKF